MVSFAAWLHENKDIHTDLAPLLGFADANAARWPYWSDEAVDYMGAIRAINPPEQDKLTALVVKYYAVWKSEQKSPTFLEIIYSNFGKIVLVGFGIYFANLLHKGLLLDTLDNPEQVRGMVTFFFVLVTTSIILLFALGIFWLQDNESVKARFEAAKDLLTIVIGVLGTIMGFYFGTATNGTANFALLNTSLTPPVITAGQSATLVSQVSGGAKPYKYSLVFTDATGVQMKPPMSTATPVDTDGKIERKIEVPAETKGGILFYVLTVTDKNNVASQTGGALTIQPKPQ